MICQVNTKIFLVKHFDKPVVVMKYPKNVKAFYMPVCEIIKMMMEDVEYVECFDLLTDIGETVGGSQRIWQEETLMKRMTEQGINIKHLSWYLDLRKIWNLFHMEGVVLVLKD